MMLPEPPDLTQPQETARIPLLLVEDETLARAALQNQLQSLGYDVTAVPDAGDALQAYQRQFFPLIVTDLGLPGMDGLEFCRQIRALPEGDFSIILVLTAWDQPEDIQTAIDLGADDYVVKPVSKELLRMRLMILERQFYHRQHRQRAERDLLASREQLRHLSMHIEALREVDRTTMAREIHDELGQMLTALKMDLIWLKKRFIADQSELSNKAASMESLIDTTIGTVKRIATELRPGLLDDLGLSAAIEWQAGEFQQRTGILCDVKIEPEEIVVNEALSTAVFRIFQEALTNVVRHAQATDVHVLLRQNMSALTLAVRDNGVGITAAQIASSNSLGLLGIRERMQFLGGEVSFQGIPGQGTTVTVKIPL